MGSYYAETLSGGFTISNKDGPSSAKMDITFKGVKGKTSSMKAQVSGA